MKALDTTAVDNYQAPRNILPTSVAFALVAGSGDTNDLTVTDNTVYPAGDSRANVLVTLADRFNKRKEYNFGPDDDFVTVNLESEGFNPVDGIDALVTVASVLLHYKDGSVFGIGVGKPTGNFIMEI